MPSYTLSELISQYKEAWRDKDAQQDYLGLCDLFNLDPASNHAKRLGSLACAEKFLFGEVRAQLCARSGLSGDEFEVYACQLARSVPGWTIDDMTARCAIFMEELRRLGV